MIRKGKIFLFILIAGITFSGLLLAKERFFLFDTPVKWPISYKTHSASFSASNTEIAPPELPDISDHTLENILSRKPNTTSGDVKIVPIESLMGMEKFTEKRRLIEFSRLQHNPYPVTVSITSGVYDLEGLTAAIANPDILEKQGNEFILKRPLYIDRFATLLIEGTSKTPLTLKLSSVTGAFIVNAGKIFILHSHVLGWNDETNQPSLFETGKEKDFRPFFASWSGSDSYFYGSQFSHLGYHLSKSYGVSFSSSKSLLKDDPLIPAPKGWIINNTFEDLYYGFYSYEAENVAIIGNTYKNNIIYGIDPHDRSKHLIIAGNTAYGTKKKHGIIVSREVDDSWIFNNLCYNNKGSGFMLDRTSVRNIVAYNRAFYNGGDGLTLFESQDNLIYGNTFIANGRSGYRLRNSWDISSAHNLVLFNKADGVQTYSFDIRETEKDRDYIMDPFTQKSSVAIANDTIIGNKAGSIKINSSESVVLSGIEFGMYWSRFLRGDIDNIGRDIAKGLASRPGTVSIRYDAALAGKIDAFKDQSLEGRRIKNQDSGSDVLGDMDEDGGAEE